jgi:predicted ATP-dependent serine protease
MNVPVAERRFICPDCKYVHLTWAPRCMGCSSLGGLVLAAGNDVAQALPVQTVPDLVVEEPQEAAKVPRPRLTIARSPQPELTDPVQELVDLGSAPSDPVPVPISEIVETSFVRFSTGMPPLDHVLGGGLVMASVVLLASPPGIGKCLGRGTPVLMFDGRVLPVEQILAGDRLMGPEGEPRTVLVTNEGIGELYRIDPIKGEPWICNDVHVLTLVDSCTDEVFDVPLNVWLSKTPSVRHHGKLISAGVKAFGTEDVELPVDPYFLGLWFGDGAKQICDGQLKKIQISKPDPEVKQTCEEVAGLWGLQVTTYDPDGYPSYTITNGSRGYGTINRLLTTMRDLLGTELRMPFVYTRAPRAQRLQFLAGLIDSDGELGSNCFVILQKREDWAREVWWMSRSLGLCATIRSRRGRCKRPDGSIFEGDYWGVVISGDTDMIPTRIPRKQAVPRQQKKVATRTGFAVEPIGEGPYFGFTLDGDGRFLLGDFTVTHNTSLTLQMMDGLQQRCLYVTGEETREQVAATARRIGAVSNRIYVVAERHLEKIFAHARTLRVQTIAVDSIQKMVCDDVNGRAGSTLQLKECTARLVQYAKTTDTALWLIGHVTSDGDIAGPKTIEHDVDVVLEMDRGPKFEGNERILNCASKNRFGPTNVMGHFELTAKGFVSVDADGWNEKL